MGSSSATNLWVLLGLGLAGILMMSKRLKKAVKEDFGAFVERLQLLPPPQPAPPKAPHPLTGLSFAVSDVFEIEGSVTTFGNIDWAKTHEPSSQTSPVVSALVQGGATCIGKTVVDEMAYSIHGENKRYDTPTNPAAPDRVPGGASSGAAVAVAANLADFSLGIDTDGGIRVPAACCGVLGFRPSHGAVSHTGIIPVSSSSDTAGWFAKDPNVLRRVGHVLLQIPFAVLRNPRNVIIADDCFELTKTPIDRTAQVVIKSVEKLFGRQILKHEIIGDYIYSKVPSLRAMYTKTSNGEVKSSSLRLLANAMQKIKRLEFQLNHQEWISSVKPTMNPVISVQVQEKLELTEQETECLYAIKNELRAAMNSLLKDDGLLVLPTIANPPPKLNSKEIMSEDYTIGTYSLLSLASMSGCCQVTIPLGLYEKCPVSVSFVARHGGDRFLLDTVQAMYATLKEQADIAIAPKSSTKVVSEETSADIAKEKGNEAFKAKQWQKAVGFYTEAIKLNGNNATYYSNRAAAYLELGSFIQAEADCSKAINFDKKNVKAYLRRGTAREMLGYYKEAIDDFNYALVLEPTNKRASLSANRLKKLFGS
ncbi:translocon at the outer membrane of chloroplasts 64-like [Impatiens glandulifera]|uniref:translocon at the outer membrane of chloroplasts 64-like n=1 Tax=Impatiens glandulifera TaxID=253017 RepID=UPI001FB186C0|nr:translocon at the outer membrane of chloroplasts 64-like [Impatiens glandulifera]